MRVLAVAGGLHPYSVNHRLLHALSELFPAGTDIVTPPVGLDTLPYYTEEFDGDDAPEGVRLWRHAVAAASALLVATPEYNGSMPGVLKNAIDLASRPRGTAALLGVPAAVAAASPNPTAARYAREHLALVLDIAGALVQPVTFGVGNAYEVVTARGFTDPAVAAEARDFIAALVHQARRV